MKSVRRIAGASHLALLIGAGALSAWGLGETAAAWGIEGRHHSLERGSASFAGLLVVIAFLVTVATRGFKVKALPLFVVSWAASVAVVSFATNGYVKSWAPATRAEAATANWLAFFAIACLVAGVAAAVWASGRQPARPDGS